MPASSDSAALWTSLARYGARMMGGAPSSERKPLLPMHPAGPYSTYRLFEWCMALMFLGIAATLALPGDTMERAALKPIAQLGFNESNLATFFAAAGSIRAMALFLNGFINNANIGPKGAYIRAGCAAGGCLVMGQLTFALVYDAFQAASPSFFIPVLGTLAMFEALSVYIACLDGVSRKSRIGQALAKLETMG